MPAIKKLVMKGFKSFAKRTELDFNNNFSVVLGPNGSGKSNVTDAICFALGTSSSKTLRAESSAKLIYHGGEKGNPAKDAEVSIVFANDSKQYPLEGDEFAVTRILKHSGQSVYKLNSKTVTRQQILDLLAAGRINPDGHNIILQGEITHFAEMRPNERREIIEEIAGISVFEDKKTKALLELEKVQARLNEAEIILAERQKTLNELKADRDSALQFKDREDLLTRSKATKVSMQVKDLEEKTAKAEGAKAGIQKEVDDIKKAIEEMKAEVAAKNNEIAEITKQIDEHSGVKQKEVAKGIEDIKESVAKKQARKEVCEGEVGKLVSRKKGLEGEIKKINSDIAELEKKKKLAENRAGMFDDDEKKITAKIDVWKKKHGLADAETANKRIGEIDAELEKLDKEIFALNQKKSDADRRKTVAELEQRGVEAKIDEIQNSLAKDKEKLAQLKIKRDEFKEVTKKLSSALNESSVFAMQLQNARAKEAEELETLAKLRARDIGIKETAASDIALQKIREANIDGVIGTVSELGTVSSKYAVALEVAAGPRLKSIVVNTDLTAAKCISYLKENRLGVVTFLPMNRMQERAMDSEAEKLLKEAGVIGLATSLVSFEPKYKNIFKYVFGSTVIVNDLNTARKLGIGRARMVTLEGDLAEQSGAMTGGFRRKTGMGFREKELEHDLEGSNAELARLQEIIKVVEDKRTNNDEEISQLRERKAVLEGELSLASESEEVVKNIEELKEKRAGFENALSAAVKELTETNARLKELMDGSDRHKQERNGLREKATKAGKASMEEIAGMESELNAIKESRMKEEGQKSTLDMQKGLLDNEIQKVNSIIAGNEKSREDFYNEIRQLNDELLAAKEQLKELEKAQSKVASEFQQMFKKKDKLKSMIAETEGRVIRQEERLMHTEEKENTFSVKIAELAGELAGAQKEFEQYSGAQLRRGLTLEQLNTEINVIEKEMKQMGNINMRALEIYEKASEECKQLLEKNEKLKIEKEDVLNMMHSIEDKKKGSFMDVFDKLTGNFKQIFSSLSAKGEVNLVIENPEDPFAAGVGVTVRVGSNKFVDIIGFSGGEKTLAALAFLFAIQEFDPAPFYLMDEVDAALDKMNSEMLSKLLSKYSEKAQYIVISHNDGVISAADSVYGVSLPKDGFGMSKVVSLRI
ncbi:MAG TPA: chromosome segregation protein SMC [Nanoarchaeota archaeon]|nr:chromosome segregation protein SMC [Nanoarchaeota archaeon]